MADASAVRVHPGSRLLPAALLGASVVGAVGALRPELFAVVAALGVAVGICAFAHSRPAPALSLAFFLLPVAQTKFRIRSAAASVSGELDAQILLELGLYAVIAAIAVCAASSAAYRRKSLTLTEVLLGVYVAVAAGSVLWSLTPKLTLVKGLQLAVLFALSLVAARALPSAGVLDVFTRSVVPYVLAGSLVAALVPTASSLAVPHSPVRRFSWFYVHPISAAILTGLAILALHARLRDDSRPRGAGFRARSVAIVTVLVVVLLATRSRGPAIALLVAGAVVLLRRRTSLRVMALVGVCVALLGAVYATAGMSFVQWLGANSDNAVIRFLLRKQTAGDIAEFSGRQELWSAARALFDAHPVIGYGYGGTRLLLLDAVPWAGDAHNALIQTALDVGLLGTVPLLGAMVLGLWSAAAGPRIAGGRMPSVQAVALGYLVFLALNSTTDVCFAEPGFLFLVIASCVPAAERLRAMGAEVAVA